jgi:hypothetical protein
MKRFLATVCLAAFGPMAQAQTPIPVSDNSECAPFKALVSFDYSASTKLVSGAEISPAPLSGIIGRCFVITGRAGSNSGICSASDAYIVRNGSSDRAKVDEFKSSVMGLAEACLGRQADYVNNGGATWEYGDTSVVVAYGNGDPNLAGAVGNRIQFNNAVPGFSR